MITMDTLEARLDSRLSSGMQDGYSGSYCDCPLGRALKAELGVSTIVIQAEGLVYLYNDSGWRGELHLSPRFALFIKKVDESPLADEDDCLDGASVAAIWAHTEKWEEEI